MSENSVISKGNGSDLLNQFELILETDPLIDEVGFVHPSQFVTLNKEVGSLLDDEDANFWNRDHKLAISTDVLLPLYKASKDAFMHATRQYKKLENRLDMPEDDSILESEVMKHSKALLLLSCDFGTAWNSRKLIVSKKQHISIIIDELHLSALVLSYSPKSEQAWCHRRWVIKMIAGKSSTLDEIVGKESELVEKIAERSKMNYRAWNHRCWLVSYMTREQVLNELETSRNWAWLHVADNSCFHYRTRLVLSVMESCHKQGEESSKHTVDIYRIWQEELDWNKALIKRYIGREALWLHRRFLALCWIRHFVPNLGDTSNHRVCKSSLESDTDDFMDNEFHLANSCSVVPDNDFEDFQAQAIYSSTYILWLTKQVPNSQKTEFQRKLNVKKMKSLLNTECPERSSLWTILTGFLEVQDQSAKEI